MPTGKAKFRRRGIDIPTELKAKLAAIANAFYEGNMQPACRRYLAIGLMLDEQLIEQAQAGEVTAPEPRFVLSGVTPEGDIEREFFVINFCRETLARLEAVAAVLNDGIVNPVIYRYIAQGIRLDNALLQRLDSALGL